MHREEEISVPPSCSQPQGSLSISVDYTPLPLTFHVHTLVYAAWMFAIFPPTNVVTVTHWRMIRRRDLMKEHPGV